MEGGVGKKDKRGYDSATTKVFRGSESFVTTVNNSIVIVVASLRYEATGFIILGTVRC